LVIRMLWYVRKNRGFIRHLVFFTNQTGTRMGTKHAILITYTRKDKILIISLHIPKTAGTALATYLDYGTKRKILYDYDDFIPKDDGFMHKYKPFLDRFTVIHGHFHYSKYREVFPDAKYITCMRNPVDRTISNYFHVMREKNMNIFSYRRIVEDKLDIVGFAKLGNMRRAQSIYLEGRDVEDYAFVGITEELDTSVEIMCRMFGIPRMTPFEKNTRVNANPNKPQVSEEVRHQIAEACYEDMHIYNRACVRFKELKKKYL